MDIRTAMGVGNLITPSFRKGIELTSSAFEGVVDRARQVTEKMAQNPKVQNAATVAGSLALVTYVGGLAVTTSVFARIEDFREKHGLLRPK